MSIDLSCRMPETNSADLGSQDEDVSYVSTKIVEIRISLRTQTEEFSSIAVPLDMNLAFAKLADREAANRNSVVQAVFETIPLPKDLQSKIGTNLNFDYGVADMILFRTASSVSATGDNESAISLLELAIENNPEFALAHSGLAELYDELGQRDLAKTHLDTAKRIDPDFPNISVKPRISSPLPSLKRAIKKNGMRKISSGVSQIHVNLQEEDFGLFAWKFSPDEYALSVRGSPTFKGMSARAYRKDHDAIFTIVGGVFDRDASTGDMKPSGLFIEDEIPIAKSANWNSGGYLLVTKNNVEIIPVGKFEDAMLKDAEYALQSNLFVVDPGGQNGIYSEGFAIANRSAFCLSPEQEYIFVVSQGGLTLFEFGDLLSSEPRQGGFGCERAMYLDGGPSTQASFEIGMHNTEVEGGWYVPTAIIVNRKTK